MSVKQLIINPGSTSTKLAVYEDKNCLFQETIHHTNEDLACFESLPQQVPFRTGIVERFLSAHDLKISDFDAIMCRGGMVWDISTGGYLVNDDLVQALKDDRYSSMHASNLGGLIGKILADKAGIPVFIYDAVTAVTLPPIARINGFPEIDRHSCCHVLNMRAMAIKYAWKQGRKYEDLNLLVVHMGGGISLSVHQKGEIIDSLGDDEGPFSPERSGSIQILEVLKLCFSGKYTYEDMKKKVRGKGGISAFLGTSDMREIEKMVEDGNEKASLLFDAQAYQVAKGIGLLSIALKGTCDAIILTGGMAYSQKLVAKIKEYITFLAPVEVMPGENEMESLAFGGLRMLGGEETVKQYSLP
ncbi:MAG: butyrate kinase [Dorea sp.]|jgi:butyrate kinase|nr:butyrate kinase [Dorea sp.]